MRLGEPEVIRVAPVVPADPCSPDDVRPGLLGHVPHVPEHRVGIANISAGVIEIVVVDRVVGTAIEHDTIAVPLDQAPGYRDVAG